MRSEQQLIRDWVEDQGKNQEDVKKLLEQLNKNISATGGAKKLPNTRNTPKDGF